jgi:hypothetical protein
MLAKEIREHIIIPTLKVANLWSPSAEILVYGTGMVETGYEHIVQNGAPADGGYGFFQEEPSDYEDMRKWLRVSGDARPLLSNILTTCYYECMPVDMFVFCANIKFATLICRMHYYRINHPLPKANDAKGMAQYHKTYYNSALGAANVEKNTEVFQRIIDGNE